MRNNRVSVFIGMIFLVVITAFDFGLSSLLGLLS